MGKEMNGDKMLYAHIEKDISYLNKPLVIGINGAITSGKTTMSIELERYLQDKSYRTQIIHIDDFHNPRSIRMKNNSPQFYLENAIDCRKFEKLISEIKSKPVNKTMALLDMGTDNYTNHKNFTTDMNTVVIVEGVFLYSSQIKHLFDYKVYLDVDYCEIIRRGRERDVPQFGKQILQQYYSFYIPVQKLYEEQCFPKQHCDLLVDNNNFKKPAIINILN